MTIEPKVSQLPTANRRMIPSSYARRATERRKSAESLNRESCGVTERVPGFVRCQRPASAASEWTPPPAAVKGTKTSFVMP